MNQEIKIEATSKISEKSLESINKILRDYNQNSNPEWWANISKKDNYAEPFYLIASNSDEEILGGLTGSSQFSWLKVDIMAVNEKLRGQGIGSMLLGMVEDIASDRGCKYIYLDTMAYQSPELYRRLGFKQVGELPDWDSFGNSKFFFMKELD